jgi:hypothetical protein
MEVRTMDMTNVKPRDVIALVALGGCLFLLYCGKDGIVTATTMAIIGYYFGRERTTEEGARAKPS